MLKIQKVILKTQEYSGVGELPAGFISVALTLLSLKKHWIMSARFGKTVGFSLLDLNKDY